MRTMTMTGFRVGDHIQIEHDPARGDEIYDRSWSLNRRQTERIWHNGKSIERWQYERITVTPGGIEVVASGQRVTARHDDESTPGMTSGTVETVARIWPEAVRQRAARGSPPAPLFCCPKSGDSPSNSSVWG